MKGYLENPTPHFSFQDHAYDLWETLSLLIDEYCDGGILTSTLERARDLLEKVEAGE